MSSWLVRCVVVVALAAGCQDPPGTAASDAATVDAAVVDANRPDAEPALPDLTVNRARAEIDLAVQTRSFEADSCELTPDENCVGAPGQRRLLHFSIETPNIGNADMILGAPSVDNEQFQFSVCHDHFHFVGYAEYELVDADGKAAATGQKQAFCLLDSEQFVTDDSTVNEESLYWCGFQGIQRGWSDVYNSRLPCQFVDVTDTPDGDYTLRISINNGGALEELTLDNNVIDIPISLGDPDLATPTEACDASVDRHSSDGVNRECGWTLGQTFSCTPGETFSLGCAEDCFGTGSCTGDAMIRVCDATRPDGNCSYPGALADADDSCGGQCPFVFDKVCPDSGEIAVYHAPFAIGEAYTCNLELFTP